MTMSESSRNSLSCMLFRMTLCCSTCLGSRWDRMGADLEDPMEITVFHCLLGFSLCSRHLLPARPKHACLVKTCEDLAKAI